MNYHTAICNWMSGDHPKHRPSFNLIFEAIWTVLRVSETDIKGSSRTESILEARHTFMFIAKEQFTYSTMEIGAELNKEHSAVISANESFKNRLITDHKGIVQKLERIVTLLNKNETIGTKYRKPCLKEN